MLIKFLASQLAKANSVNENSALMLILRILGDDKQHLKQIE